MVINTVIGKDQANGMTIFEDITKSMVTVINNFIINNFNHMVNNEAIMLINYSMDDYFNLVISLVIANKN